MKLLFLLGLILFLVALVRLFRKRKRWSAFFSFLLTTLITLSVVEVIYRAFIRKPAYTETGNFGNSMNQLNNTYGYTVKDIPVISHIKVLPAGDTVYNARYTIMADTGFNKQDINHRVGYRQEGDTARNPELVFLGCSFTFGSGLNDTATLPWLAGKMAGTDALNLGGSGWGTHHVYQLFTRKYQQVPDDRKRVFVYSFIPDHVLRAKCIHTWSLNDPYYEVEGDSLHAAGAAYKHTSYARWHLASRVLSLNRALSFISDLETTLVTLSASKNIGEDDYKRIALMLQSINRTIRQRGDRFIIVHWNDYKGPTPKDPSFVSKEKMEAVFAQLQTQGAEVINVSDLFNFNDPAHFIAKDNHPSNVANRLIAQKVVQQIGR